MRAKRAVQLMAVLVGLSTSAWFGSCGGSSTPDTWSVSGTVSGAVSQGVTMSLTGASSAITTTDATGHYSFAGLVDGTYTVTPAFSRFFFEPTSRSITVRGAGVAGQDFTATAFAPRVISGTVSGAASQGVTMNLALTNSTTTATDTVGHYSFHGLDAGVYTVTPSLPGYSFNPVTRVVTVSGADIGGQDFTAAAADATCTGDVSIASASAWEAFVARGCTYVTGSVTVTATDLEDLEYGALVAVDGTLTISSNTSLAAVTLNGLSIVGNGLVVEDNAQLSRLTLPALTARGSVLISDNQALSSVSLPALTTAFVLGIARNTALESVSLPALTGLVGGFIDGNPALTSLSFPSLVTTVRHTLSISDNAFLTSLNLSALTTGWVYVHGTALASLSLPALTSGGLSISGTALTSLNLPALTHSAVWISGTALTSLSLPALTGCGYTAKGPLLSISDNPALETVSLPLVSDCWVGIRGNTALTILELPAMANGSLVVSNSALTSIRLPVMLIATLTISDNTMLAIVSAPALASASLFIENNTALTTVAVPALTAARGLTITGNTSYPQCAAEAILAQLIDFTGTATISGNDMTATCPP